MTDLWTNRWNERYQSDEFAYGKQPNQYFKEQIDQLKPGKILLAAEGEGRNAVYAAQIGWTVSAFDISTEGRNKAIQLATESNVNIDYQIGELQELDYSEGSFDVIALIFAHFPAEIKSAYHRILDRLLRSQGTIIFEAFSKKHIDFVTKNPEVGGPKDIPSLFSLEELQHDFAGYDIVEREEKQIKLNEGLFHNGEGSVIRFVGRKN